MTAVDVRGNLVHTLGLDLVGPDRRDSFFAQTHTTQASHARLYLGVAAQGRSLKVILLRVYLAMLGAAQKWYVANGGKKNKDNPADPYMTLVGYFNSLRELGGSRRIIEDEVSTQITNRSNRKREGEVDSPFAVYQGRSVFKRLAERMEERPGLRVSLFLDVQRYPTDSSLDGEVLRRFVHRFRTQEWPGEKLPELYYDPRSLHQDAVKRSSLHAKCVVVDRRVAFVTSANFTEAAQTRNIEVGALIRCEQFAARLAGHFETLADVGLLNRLASDFTQ